MRRLVVPSGYRTLWFWLGYLAGAIWASVVWPILFVAFMEKWR